jgi:hypothetical protein
MVLGKDEFLASLSEVCDKVPEMNFQFEGLLFFFFFLKPTTGIPKIIIDPIIQSQIKKIGVLQVMPTSLDIGTGILGDLVDFIPFLFFISPL